MKNLKKTSQCFVICGVGAALLIGPAVSVQAGITTYSDSTTFDTAIATPLYVENFGANASFPITTGVLNQYTSLVVADGPPITPGEILPGVTYSTPIGSGNFFNIDFGGGYTGGFLDSVEDTLALTVTFDKPTEGFGFNANSLMGAFEVTVNRDDGASVSLNFAQAQAMNFYGFISSSTDITSLTVLGDSSTFSFALDNFTYPVSAASSSVPDGGSSLTLLGFGLTGIALARRRLAKA
jgi:hypothetical protein